MRFRRFRNLVVAGLFIFFSNQAVAYDRYVVVNGSLVSTGELVLLDMLHGEYIPNGRYWLNLNTGQWGYEGGSAQGMLGGEYYRGSSLSSGCKDGFDYDCTKANFCEENPGVC